MTGINYESAINKKKDINLVAALQIIGRLTWYLSNKTQLRQDILDVLNRVAEGEVQSALAFGDLRRRFPKLFIISEDNSNTLMYDFLVNEICKEVEQPNHG